jgi:hypothetical protein
VEIKDMTGINAIIALASVACLACTTTPDAALLKTGEFVYRNFQNGKTIGRDRIVIARRPSGRYRFSNVAIGYADQTWAAVVLPDFTPVSAVLASGGFKNRREIFNIRYRRGHVTGVRYRRQGSNATPVRVEDVVKAGVIDQRIDWASVMARKLETGARFAFQVYDPALATSAAVAKVEDGGQIHVPAGNFETFEITYRIEKATGSEKFVVFATKAVPHILVREDFPDGVSSQLEKAR